VSINLDTVGSDATRPNNRLGPDLGDIGKAVPTDRDRDQQIQRHLPRVVDGQRPHPRPQRRGQFPIQSDLAGRRGQQHRTRVRTTRFAVVSTVSDG